MPTIRAIFVGAQVGKSGVLEHKSSCLTRKLSYHKDDRAMRPIAYASALKIFGSPQLRRGRYLSRNF